MKKLLPKLSLMLLCLLPLQWTRAQSDVPLATFSATGATSLTQAGTMVSFTFGQVAFSHFDSSDVSVTEGVQQIFCIPYFDTVEYEVCQNDASDFLDKMPEGFTLPEEVTPEVPGTYKFVLRTLSLGGCDSIVWITLHVHPTFDTTLHAQAEGHYSWQGSDFSESGEYSKMLYSVHGCDSLLTLSLALTNPGVPIPQIYVYFDKMLMVDHNAGEEATDYHYYRWYQGDELIAEGEDLDTYRNRDGSLLQGCYHLEVPTAPDRTYWVSSNTICIGTTVIDDIEQDEIDMTIGPNPVTSGELVRINISLVETQLQTAKVFVYDAQGRKVAERAARPITQLQATFPSGVYSVHVVLPGGRHAVRKLIVR